METTEKIVEAYVRYIKKWATLPNIKCRGQYEIDLLAIDLNNCKRYHIESGVSISTGFSKLTTKPFSSEDLKIRTKTAEQRRTLGYFLERKFGHECVVDALKAYGFEAGSYTRLIVTWSATEAAKIEAANHGIELWYFPRMMDEIIKAFRDQRTYFTDDTLRTLHLYAKVRGETRIDDVQQASDLKADELTV
jgi:hypothetical protein